MASFTSPGSAVLRWYRILWWIGAGAHLLWVVRDLIAVGGMPAFGPTGVTFSAWWALPTGAPLFAYANHKRIKRRDLLPLSLMLANVVFIRLAYMAGYYIEVPGGSAFRLDLHPGVVACLGCALIPTGFVVALQLWEISGRRGNPARRPDHALAAPINDDTVGEEIEGGLGPTVHRRADMRSTSLLWLPLAGCFWIVLLPYY